VNAYIFIFAVALLGGRGLIVFIRLFPLTPLALFFVDLSTCIYLITIPVTTNMIGVTDAYYCRECVQQEKDRDGCPKIVNLGSAKTDLFYERKKYGFKKR